MNYVIDFINELFPPVAAELISFICSSFNCSFEYIISYFPDCVLESIKRLNNFFTFNIGLFK